MTKNEPEFLSTKGANENETESQNSLEVEGETKSFSSPRLNSLEKLYVKTYLHSMSHATAYRSVAPGLKKYSNSNPYSQRENIKYHISLALQSKMEALSLDPNKIIERLYHEALREGNGSNHSARIQALNLLGKHLGMFTDEKKGDVYQINIVNYSSKPTNNEGIADDIIEKLESPNPSNISIDFEIENYDPQEIEYVE